MSITLTLPVEILENIDIVRVQANQIARLQNRLDEANTLNARISQQLAAAMVEIRSLRDQITNSLPRAMASAPPVPKSEPIVIKASTSVASLRDQTTPSQPRVTASAPTVPKPEPIVIKASTSAASLRPNVKLSHPQSDDGIEPDTEWKQTLKKKIEEELRPMVNDAQDNYNLKLKGLPPASDTLVRQKVSQEYNAAMTSIRGLATEHFQTALERERQERRWAAGLELSPEWNEALKKEQQSIMMKLAAERRQSLNRDSRSSASN